MPPGRDACDELCACTLDHAQMWRLAAWAASGGVYAAQICHERFVLGSTPGRTALHAVDAAAIGAFALAIAGPLHFFLGNIRRTALLALVLWPAITAVPSFLVAVVVAWVLARLRPGAGASWRRWRCA